MLLIDGFSSYRTVVFLKSKLAEGILKILKIYHAETKCQTAKTLKQVRLDMGKEWYNRLWEE